MTNLTKTCEHCGNTFTKKKERDIQRLALYEGVKCWMVQLNRRKNAQSEMWY